MSPPVSQPRGPAAARASGAATPAPHHPPPQPAAAHPEADPANQGEPNQDGDAGQEPNHQPPCAAPAAGGDSHWARGRAPRQAQSVGTGRMRTKVNKNPVLQRWCRRCPMLAMLSGAVAAATAAAARCPWSLPLHV